MKSAWRKFVPAFLPAILVGIAVSAVAGVVMGKICGGLGTGSALTSLFLGACGAIAAGYFLPSEKCPRFTWGEGIVGFVFLLAVLRSFLWIIYEADGDIMLQSPYNLGDLALHIHLIRYLASGVEFWPESSLLAGQPLTYPIGMDLWNSLLLLMGIPLEQGLIWTGLICSALAFEALRRWGGWVAVAFLLFNGGLEGFAFFSSARVMDYQSEAAWKNLFLSVFVPQRGFLFALPAGLWLLKEWRAVFSEEGRRPLSHAQLVVQALLYGVMPLFSAHTFLFLSVILAALFVQSGSREVRKHYVLVTVLAAVAAVPFCLLVTARFSVGGGIHWKPGWMMENREWLFWPENFGISLLLWLVALGLVCWKDRDRTARAFLLPATLLFLLCCVVSFSTWPWDNIKLMLWCWLVLAPPFYSHVLAPLTVSARVAICFLLFCSGAISLMGGLLPDCAVRLIERKEYEPWEKFLSAYSKDTIFLCAPDYNHPVFLLGRPVFAAYEGWLWSHGLNYTEGMLALRMGLAGEGLPDSISKDVRMRTQIVYGPREEGFLKSGR